MRHSRLCCALFLAACMFFPLWAQENGLQTASKSGDVSTDTAVTQVPKGVILVKGAWSSASDSVTPVPENGTIVDNVFSDPYFGLTFPFPKDWEQKYTGPPPSDSGRYVLADITPAETLQGPMRGNMLLMAQDMFFTPLHVANALELVHYTREHLQADYKAEGLTTQIMVAGRPFTLLKYWSPSAELHWYVLATEIRCHALEIVLTSKDTKLLKSLLVDLNNMKLPAEANPTGGIADGVEPVCLKDYAQPENTLKRIDPILTDRRFNPIPIRIIIDREGNVKHIHFLSAFPDQASAITDAVKQWKFKPYLQNGHPMEVETGIMFGRIPSSPPPERKSRITVQAAKQ